MKNVFIKADRRAFSIFFLLFLFILKTAIAQTNITVKNLLYREAYAADFLNINHTITDNTTVDLEKNIRFNKDAAVNDECANAILLIPGSNAICNTVTGDLTGATQSLPPLKIDGFKSDEPIADVWFKFTATSQNHTITVNPSGIFDAVIDVREGACNGVSIASEDSFTEGTAELLILNSLTAGATYYIRIYHYHTSGNAIPSTPTFDICITTPCFSESFTGNSFPPLNWTGNNVERSTTLADYNTGPASAIFSMHNGELITPALTNPKTLSFYLGRNENAESKIFNTNVSTISASGPFTTIATYDNNNVPPRNYGNYFSVDLSAYTSSSNVWIQFEKISTTNSPWRLDDIRVYCDAPSCISADAIEFISQPTEVEQGNKMSAVKVRAYCTVDGTTAESFTGSITLTAINGCGYVSETVNAINGVATFNNITFTRSPQNGVQLQASSTGFSSVLSNSFNVTAPVGSPTITTLKNENFDGASPGWTYMVGTPTEVSGTDPVGTDVTGIQNFEGNNVLAKSYSINNNTDEPGTRNTITFDNVTNLNAYNSVKFSFQLGSLFDGSDFEGAGNDANEDILIETSIDNGTSWVPLLTYRGSADYLFLLSSANPVTLPYNANIIVDKPSVQSAYVVNLPGGVSQFRFRITATNNRRNENWAIDNLQLAGTVYEDKVAVGLPTATGYTLNTCPNYNNVITAGVSNTVGNLNYLWSPNISINNTTVSNPAVNPASTTTYNVSVTDEDQCKATASIVINIPNGASGVWTGVSDNDWFDCRNWSNGTVPGNSTDVTIASTANNSVQINATSVFASSYGRVANSGKITVDNNTVSFAEPTDKLLATGDVIIQNNDGLIDMTKGGVIEIQGNWSNKVNTLGKGFISGTGKIIFTGSSNQSISTVNSEEFFHDLELNKSTGLLNMNSNITVSHDLKLNSGIATTGNHLFTFSNTGTLSQPSDYTKSYICLCNSTGNAPISFSKPFNGSVGFRIRNIVNTDTYFPVGVDLVSPNRMMINNHGFTDDITVAMEKGDIGNTELSRVNRIWYLKQSDPSKDMKTDMRLYFTKQDQSQFLITQDEVEDGFNYADIHLVQKNYSDADYLNVAVGSDVPTLSVGPELYAKYSYGVSADVNKNKFGIDTFTRFSIVNITDFVLPVSLINFKAYIYNFEVKTEWTSVNETGIKYYEVERSQNANQFITIGTVQAKNNAATIQYNFIDAHPLNGDNLYRIKAIDKNGKHSYTQIVKVQFTNPASLINIYPNPAKKHLLNLQLQNLPSSKYTLNIYTANGSLIYSILFNHFNNSSLNKIQLPVSIKAGLYILRLTNGVKNYTKSLLIE